MAAVALAGCVAAPQPDPAMTKLMSACNGGDTQACATVAQINASRPAPFVPHFEPMSAAPYMQPVAPMQNYMGRTTSCQPRIGGGMICNSY